MVIKFFAGMPVFITKEVESWGLMIDRVGPAMRLIASGRDDVKALLAVDNMLVQVRELRARASNAHPLSGIEQTFRREFTTQAVIVEALAVSIRSSIQGRLN